MTDKITFSLLFLYFIQYISFFSSEAFPKHSVTKQRNTV